MNHANLQLFQRVHNKHVHRAPWPDFAALDLSSVDLDVRREACRHWLYRAASEHGSVFQFSEVMLALSQLEVPLEIEGTLSRLIADELRHVELCYKAAAACDPDGVELSMRRPEAPWRRYDENESEIERLAWTARAILIACCLGETLSKPMLRAIMVLTTEPVIEGVARQILRDEELHSSFGWSTLAYLLTRGGLDLLTRLQADLGQVLASFEKSTAHGIPVSELANSELKITRNSAERHLGTLTPRQCAFMFYATVEGEIFEQLTLLGFDPISAWRNRHAKRKA